MATRATISNDPALNQQSISWAARYFPGVRLRAGAPAGFPNLLKSPPWSNPASRPGHQTMPKCRFNKSNASSSGLATPSLAIHEQHAPSS